MLYNLGIHLFRFTLRILAIFNRKINLGVKGRDKAFGILTKNIGVRDKIIWLHCSSLGEYEQGLPVFKNLRKHYKNHKIVLTFFSPSGYEIKKHTEVADVVCYLPIDTPNNAKKFVEILKPELTVYVKYDIWANYLGELKKRQLKSILISALIRPDQPYFKWYGRTLREALKSFNHIFVQNKESKILLEKISYNDVTITGDTRYDRVYSQLQIDNNLPWLSAFKNDKLLIVFGSTWPEDEELIIQYINQNPSDKIRYLIAPHEIHAKHIQYLKTKLEVPYALYTDIEKNKIRNAPVIILNTIGQLSKAYAYADIAFVGGAMGKTGLHNILEPAVFGIPIIIGKNYKKFPEAIELVKEGGLISVKNYAEFKTTLNQLLINSESRKKNGIVNKRFIEMNKGAVIQIMDYLRI